MKTIKIITAMLFLCISFIVNAGLTPMCDPPQNLTGYVSYIDKASTSGATANSFEKEVQQTIKGTTSGYLDYFKPSHFKFAWRCDGPCSFESESTFIRLQYGRKAISNELFKNFNFVENAGLRGRSEGALYVGFRNDIQFDGYFNGKKIPPSITQAVDDLIRDAKTKGTILTEADIDAVPGLNSFFNQRYTTEQYPINIIKSNPKKPFIVNLNGLDKNGVAVAGHSVNIILEGSTPTSRIIFISNGEISTSMEVSQLTDVNFRDSLIKTMGSSKVKSLEYTLWWD